MKRLRPLTAWILGGGAALVVLAGLIRFMAAGRQPEVGPAPEPVRLHLNQATARELCLVSGMTLAVAEDIVRYRHRHGRIRAFDELSDIRGLGPVRLRQLQAETILGPEDTPTPH